MSDQFRRHIERKNLKRWARRTRATREDGTVFTKPSIADRVRRRRGK